MITDAIVTAFAGALSAILGLAPSFDVPDFSANSHAIWIVRKAQDIFPLTVLVDCLIAYYTIVLAMQAWDLAVWAYHQIHGAD